MKRRERVLENLERALGSIILSDEDLVMCLAEFLRSTAVHAFFHWGTGANPVHEPREHVALIEKLVQLIRLDDQLCDCALPDNITDAQLAHTVAETLLKTFLWRPLDEPGRQIADRIRPRHFADFIGRQGSLEAVIDQVREWRTMHPPPAPR